MKEILPGVLHWTRLHPKIKFEVSSYYLVDERVLIDPLQPEEGVDGFSTRPETILLTNRHHYRDSGQLRETFDCSIHCVESGMHEFKQGEPVQAFSPGDPLPGGIQAIEIGVISPDETALFIPKGDGIIALADGAIRLGEGPLGFVPEEYMGDNPEGIKTGLRQAFRPLLDYDFDHLLLAHGPPQIGGGKNALREFVEG